MCLSIPGRVVSVEGQAALVDFWGVRRKVRLETVDEAVQPGDYILNHVGFAIKRIPEEEVASTLALYDGVLASKTGDMMRQDVVDELRGAEDDAAETTGEKEEERPLGRRDAEALMRELGIEL